MSKAKMFFQCDLSQGSGRDHGYIEERGAVIGNTVELNPGSGDFWTVTSVATKGLTEDEVKVLQDRFHKGWAKSIDI